MSLSNQVLKSSIWVLAISWLNRFVGMISTLILIRVLSPEDFGIAALATMVMFFFMSFSELGIRQYIIKEQHITDDEVNSAWTLQILINLGIGLLLFFSAPYLAEFLKDDKLKDVLRVLSLVPLLGSLNNPGMVLLEKKLDYAKLGKVGIRARLISAPPTVYIAYIYESYWALIIGQILSIAITFALTYVYISYRPKFRCSGFKHIFSKTKWLLANSLTGFARSKAENFIVNNKFGTEGVGLYDISREFSHLPYSDIIGPASKPLLAGISSIKGDLAQVYEGLLKHLYVSLFFIIPSIVGTFAVGEFFVYVAMGEQWMSAVDIFKAISLLMPVFIIYSLCRQVMFFADELKLLSIADIFSIIVMFVVLGAPFVADLTTLTWIRVLIGFLFVLVLISLLKFRYKLKVLPIFTLLTIVSLLSAPFYLSIESLKLLDMQLPAYLLLLLYVSLGVLVYFLTVFLVRNILSNHNHYFLFTYEFIDKSLAILTQKFK
ncbi:oligosaccharide flippase family protein [Paraglaciecola aquimarina]|uniref:Oligosaccharide flippase family protein n=1 Tax=Paraglaciecola aquimarina TaxID=1235557 RepID=A0ABU3T286_9ALTE|nr:oligosaccharide flippase family protein [Paraglaciecola aquimarina]MDU0356374.1 oligosaccharide flippase family protein [Paraglaciecola aquimarina]